MKQPSTRPIDIHSEEFLRLLMRRQLRLSIGCAATFLGALLGKLFAAALAAPL